MTVSSPSGPLSLPFRVAALYQFTRFEDPAALRAPLLALCQEEGIRGILLLAGEGINGTIAGAPEAIERVVAHLRALPGCAGLEVKYSGAPEMPFLRMKVRLKREIVTMGVEGADPCTVVGRYVAPKDWNALLADPDTLLIDTRNDYEVRIGTFRGAVNPNITHFRQFPAWFREVKRAFEAEGRTPKVAMFCTGGIRCEKSTALACLEGVEEVYHLKGGILKYLEEIPPEESLWEGECFVFDQRVSVGHGLAVGEYTLCGACRAPVSPQERASPAYDEGVSCPHCQGRRSAGQRARYRQRQAQMALAAERGQAHLHDGNVPPKGVAERDRKGAGEAAAIA